MRTKQYEDDLARRDNLTLNETPQPASTNEKAPHYWYETQERAFAPGIADGWPKVLPAHTKNGRLVRRTGNPDELLAALRECRDAVAAAMRVIHGLDTMTRLGMPADTYEQRFVDECHAAGVKDGFGVRADAAIAKAEGR